MPLKKGDVVEIVNCVEAGYHVGEKWKVDFLTQLKESYRIESLKTGFRDTYNKKHLRKVK